MDSRSDEPIDYGYRGASDGDGCADNDVISEVHVCTGAASVEVGVYTAGISGTTDG